MPKNSTINLRVNAEIKEQSGKILAGMGLTFSEAFNLMLHQVCIRQALPFDVVAYDRPNQKTAALMERLENGKEKPVGPFSTKDELWEALGL